MENTTISSLPNNKCCGCAACMDRCPTDAIQMIIDEQGDRRPVVDSEKCISCGACIKVCPQYKSNNTLHQDIPFKKKSYIGLFDSPQTKKSSSGGVFLALAKYVINNLSGVVYGAAIVKEDDKLCCKHIRVDSPEELIKIQGSKYAQSRTDGIYKQVKNDLKKGRTVLFSGTSCQVASLKNYCTKTDNLITVDLICHGVPKDVLFYDYIDFIEKKENAKLLNVSFRSKQLSYHGDKVDKVLTLNFQDKRKKCKVLFYPESPYYLLFMLRAGYRTSCYHCVYANKNKPSDITLGDYSLHKEEITKYSLDASKTYSSVIVHSEVGENFLKSASGSLKLYSIDTEYMISLHGNLNSPSKTSKEGDSLLGLYTTGGYELLQKYIERKQLKSTIRWYVEKVIQCTHLNFIKPYLHLK